MAKTKSTGTSSGASNAPGGAASSKDSHLPIGSGGTIKKHTKRKSKTPTKIAQKGGANSGKQIFVCKVRSGDMVMMVEKNGGAPFLHPTITYLNTNADFRRNMLSIHQMHSRVDPDDHHRFKEQLSTSGYNKRFPVFINIVDEVNIPLNNPANRKAWGETFEHFHNHAATQSAYSFPEDAHYSGDITPQNEDAAPFLSHFLTIQDTMEVMREAYAADAEPGSLPSIGDMLDDNGAMENYYGPALIPEALQHFASYRNHLPIGKVPAANMPDHQHPDYGDFQRFAF